MDQFNYLDGANPVTLFKPKYSEHIENIGRLVASLQDRYPAYVIDDSCNSAVKTTNTKTTLTFERTDLNKDKFPASFSSESPLFPASFSPESPLLGMIMKLDHVIFSNDTTIVFFNDGSKEVVKRMKGDADDREVAVMYAIMKHTCPGFKNTLRKRLKEAEEQEKKAISEKEAKNKKLEKKNHA